MKRVLITGSRSWENERVIRQVLNRLIERQPPRSILIIAGGAPGVDTIAEREAKKLGIHVARIDALWDSYERSAGPTRNGVMLALKPRLVIAFHWNLADSKGTKNCVERAERKGIPVKRIEIPRAVAMPSGERKKKRT
jgi:hypothetical protein